MFTSHIGPMMLICREWWNVAFENDADYNELRQRLVNETARLKKKQGQHLPEQGCDVAESFEWNVMDPVGLRNHRDIVARHSITCRKNVEE